MTPVGFEPAIPASARPKAHALDSAATGIGMNATNAIIKLICMIYSKITLLQDMKAYGGVEV
jgi:hypothetical protein